MSAAERAARRLFGQECPAPGAGVAGQSSPTVIPVTATSAQQGVNARGNVNCAYYQPQLTDCAIRRIKDEQTADVMGPLVLSTVPGSGLWEIDLVVPGISNVLQLVSFAISANGVADASSLVRRIRARPVFVTQRFGELVEVYGKSDAASGPRLVTKDGRCTCDKLEVCQTAWHTVRLSLYTSLLLAADAVTITSLDFCRRWNDDACVSCYPCEIPEYCGEELYEALT